MKRFIPWLAVSVFFCGWLLLVLFVSPWIWEEEERNLIIQIFVYGGGLAIVNDFLPSVSVKGPIEAISRFIGIS